MKRYNILNQFWIITHFSVNTIYILFHGDQSFRHFLFKFNFTHIINIKLEAGGELNPRASAYETVPDTGLTRKIIWSTWRDLNSHHSDYKTDVLPIRTTDAFNIHSLLLFIHYKPHRNLCQVKNNYFLFVFIISIFESVNFNVVSSSHITVLSPPGL